MTRHILSANVAAVLTAALTALSHQADCLPQDTGLEVAQFSRGAAIERSPAREPRVLEHKELSEPRRGGRTTNAPFPVAPAGLDPGFHRFSQGLRPGLGPTVPTGLPDPATSKGTGGAVSAAPTAEESPQDLSRFNSLAARYREVLQRRPRRGTAFDLWYGHYLDAGKLDELVSSLKQEIDGSPEDPTVHILLGLVAERRGIENEAAAAFARAEKLAPDNYYPPLLRASLLARQLKFDEAALAIARSIERNPPRAELLDLYKQLGRLQMRQQQNEAALKTWDEIAERFPDDRSVLKELAELLAQEDQYDQAIRRWKQVAALSQDDPYGRLEAEVQIAQLNASHGKPKTAVALFDLALEQVKPGSWQARDIRSRIENTFLSSDDLSGLASYCEERLSRKPDDIDTLLQLARTLSLWGKHTEACDRYQQAIKLAPSRRDIREALIAELRRDGFFPEALAECELLRAAHPKDVEVLEMLGELHLKAASAEQKHEAQRMAIDVWKQIAAVRPDDANLAIQVAEICRRAARIPNSALGREFHGYARRDPQKQNNLPLVAAAEEYYREAVSRASDAPEYYEHLGEFLHALGRQDEAIATFSKIISPTNDTDAAWHRLAKVLAGFGYLKQAIEAGEKSLDLDSENFDFHDFQIELLVQDGRHEEALERVKRLRQLAASFQQEERALDRTVEVYAASDQVDATIERLGQLQKQGKGTLQDQWLLGLLYARNWRFAEAAESLKLAIQFAPDDLRLLRAYAGLLERSGDIGAATAQYRRLAECDSRNRVKHYGKIVQLELRQEHSKEAREAADQLVRLSVSNADSYLLLAAVAFRLGETEEGLNALRRAVQLVPRDTSVRGHLAQSLADHDRPNEAIEHYWRCFELADDLSDKLPLVSAITHLSVKTQQYDKLLDKLRQLRRRHEAPKQLTLCLVQALRVRKEHTEARRELTDLLATRPDDVDVLSQLADLSATTGDLSAAIAYQQRIVDFETSRASLGALASYYVAKGEMEEAAKVWGRIMAEMGDDSSMIAAIDRRLRRGEFQNALTLVLAGVEIAPESWRLNYRAGYIHLALSQFDAAQQAFDLFQRIADSKEIGGPAQTPAQRRQRHPWSPTAAATTQPVLQIDPSGRLVISTSSAATSPSVPELLELSAAKSSYAAINQLLALGRNRSGGGSRSSSSSRSYQRMLSTAIRLPSSLEQARTDCLLAMSFIAERQGRQESWGQSANEEGRDDPRKLRRLLLAHYAAGQLQRHPVLIDAVIAALPDDPLPHVARFYQVATSPTGDVGPKDKQRLLQSLQESFRWIADHRPSVTGSMLYYYGRQLGSA